jgi:hypothetical protein
MLGTVKGVPQHWHSCVVSMSKSRIAGMSSTVAISLRISTDGSVSPFSQRDTACRVT